MGEKKVEAFLVGSIREKMEIQKAKLAAEPVQKPRDYKGEIAALRTKIDRLKDLYVNDLITLEQCKKDQQTYLDKINMLEQESKDKEAPDFMEIEKILSAGWETIYNGLKNEQKQEFWRILIKEIRVYPDRHMEYDLRL